MSDFKTAVVCRIEKIEQALNQKFLNNKLVEEQANNSKIASNHLDLEFDTSLWPEEELHLVIKEMLDGMWHFYKEITDSKSFPMANFNNVRNVFGRKEMVLFINKKSIPRFNPDAQTIIAKYSSAQKQNVSL